MAAAAPAAFAAPACSKRCCAFCFTSESRNICGERRRQQETRAQSWVPAGMRDEEGMAGWRRGEGASQEWQAARPGSPDDTCLEHRQAGQSTPKQCSVPRCSLTLPPTPASHLALQPAGTGLFQNMLHPGEVAVPQPVQLLQARSPLSTVPFCQACRAPRLVGFSSIMLRHLANWQHRAAEPRLPSCPAPSPHHGLPLADPPRAVAAQLAARGGGHQAAARRRLQ